MLYIRGCRIILDWTLQVDGQTNVFPSTGYGEPFISSINGVNFSIASGVSVGSGGVVDFEGESFGPTFDLVDESHLDQRGQSFIYTIPPIRARMRTGAAL